VVGAPVLGGRRLTWETWFRRARQQTRSWRT